MSQLKDLIKQPAPDATWSRFSTIPDRIVRPAEQVIITGRSLASIWRDQKAGTFPPNIQIGARAVGVRLSALIAWMDSRETITTDNVTQVCVGARRGRKPKSAVVGG